MHYYIKKQIKEVQVNTLLKINNMLMSKLLCVEFMNMK